MGAVWSALLVGGGLAGALLLWLLRGDPGDPGKDPDAQPQKVAPPGEAAVPGSEQGGGGGVLGPGPSKRDLATKPEHLQESNGHLISETKGLGTLQEAQRLQNPGADWGNVPTGQIPDTRSRADSEVSRNTSLDSHVEWRIPKAAASMAEKFSSSNLLVDRAKEASQDPAGHEDWEVVSRHSSWGDVGLGGSLEVSGFSISQGMDYGRNTLVGARGQEAGGKVMSPEPQQVRIQFQVHYTTSTKVQFIAVTGDHESLGSWNTYIPLHYCKDGLWSLSVFLPADTVVEWKFVLVENGEVTRWEECSNRLLQTGHEDKVVQGWWGIH
uniref:Starch-binding domain-containing protein 1 n=1 Tax=Nannospalax galili TaxID=1026970 RepID=A0A8C6R613_NANGA